jgi:hypothetical protein
MGEENGADAHGGQLIVQHSKYVLASAEMEQEQELN